MTVTLGFVTVNTHSTSMKHVGGFGLESDETSYILCSIFNITNSVCMYAISYMK